MLKPTIALSIIASIGGMAISFWITHAIMSAEKDRAIATAVDSVTATLNQEIEKEREIARTYKALSDDKYEKLQEQVGKIKIQKTNTINTVTREIERNPSFYSQPLPEDGRVQWEKSRELFATPSGSPE